MKTKILILLFALAPVMTQAQVNYAVSGNTAYVTNSPNASGNVVIATTYDGYPVTSIGDSAFAFCSGLTSITIPNSVSSIGDVAFGNCFGLTNIAVDAANPNYSSTNRVLFDKDQATLIQYPIGLANSSYTIPDSVTSIGDDAFVDCSGLTSVTIGANVTSIGEGAFAGCSGLTSITIPNSVTSIGDQAFTSSGLTSVTIPDSVASIGGSAFAACSGLTSVTIPDSVTSIGDGAFEGCSGLTSITIPNSVTSIGNQEFYDCGLTSVTIGNGVTSIGFDAFEDCTRLTSVTIPDSVTSIGNFAFFGCSGLRQAYFQGNAPLVDGAAGSADTSVFYGEPGTVYYYAGTTGWGSTFGSWPTALWYQPQPQILSSGLGAQNNQFGFTISWATNLSIVVQAATNLANPVWIPLSTNTLINGTNAFTDPTWANYPQRFYRVQ